MPDPHTPTRQPIISASQAQEIVDAVEALPTDPADQSLLEAAITACQSALTTLLNAIIATLAAATAPSNTLTGTSQQTSGTGGLSSFSAYTQIISSTTKASPFSHFGVSVRNGNNAADKILVQVAVGGSGSERVIGQALFLVPANSLDGHGCLPIEIKEQIPAGTRVSYRSSCEGATGATIALSWAVSQVA